MSSSLYQDLSRLIASQPELQIAVDARRLSTAEELQINSDSPFHPASTMKICILMEVFHQRSLGILSLEEPVQILNVFPSLADGSLFSLDPADDSEKGLYDRVGVACSVGNLAERMITLSSNLAANLLLARVSPRRTSEFMAALGAPELRLIRGMEDKVAYRLGLNNSATAGGFSKILTKLARRQIISPEDCNQMVGILCGQELNEMIPAGLPGGTQVAHKTGWIDGHFHDVGIVDPFGPDPVVLSIMTRGWKATDTARAHAFVANLARIVYDAWH